MQQLIDAKVAEVMGSDLVQQTLQQRLENERRRMEGQVQGRNRGGLGRRWHWRQ